jgi:hypothetical protein
VFGDFQNYSVLGLDAVQIGTDVWKELLRFQKWACAENRYVAMTMGSDQALSLTGM